MLPLEWRSWLYEKPWIKNSFKVLIATELSSLLFICIIRTRLNWEFLSLKLFLTKLQSEKLRRKNSLLKRATNGLVLQLIYKEESDLVVDLFHLRSVLYSNNGKRMKSITRNRNGNNKISINTRIQRYCTKAVASRLLSTVIKLWMKIANYIGLHWRIDLTLKG